MSLKNVAELIKNSGKKITECVYWKSRQSHLRMFFNVQSTKIVLSLNVDIIYGFAVNSEWKKIMPETNVRCDLGSHEWHIEIQMYILLGGKTKFKSKLGRNNIVSNYPNIFSTSCCCSISSGLLRLFMCHLI